MWSFTTNKNLRARRARVIARFASVAACALVLATSVGARAAVWTSSGPLGGNVFTVAFDPVTPSTVYAGSNGGGIF
jgi:hypothetical protein